MARTYLPTLIALVRRICIYTARYEDTIRANLAGTALVAYEALLAACTGFLAATEN